MNMKLYNVHTIMNSYMHIQCIEVYELITKLYLHSKQFNMHIYINYELEHYEIEYIMRYEIISIYKYEII